MLLLSRAPASETEERGAWFALAEAANLAFTPFAAMLLRDDKDALRETGEVDLMAEIKTQVAAMFAQQSEL